MQQQRAAACAVFKEYLAAVCQLPQIFRRTAFRRRTLDEELQEALLRGNLRRALTGIDLWLLGMGIVIGSSWALLTGIAAQQFAGAAIILSYLFSGLAMLLAACCFAELCVEFPVSGGAFSYVMINFGEFPAFFTLGGLMLEYALGMAAIARGFSRFVARLCNISPSLFLVELWHCPPGVTVNAADVATISTGANSTIIQVPAIDVCTTYHSFDFMAAAIVMIITALLSLGVQRSTLFISSLTTLKIFLIVLISIVGYTQAGPSCTNNYAPCCVQGGGSGCGLQDAEDQYCKITFAAHCNASNLSSSTDPFWDPDFSVDGLFLGAAALFFTYNGLDAICNAAEEAKDVAHLPWALVGTVGASTVLYVMLAVAMVFVGLPNVAKPMLPPDEPYLTFAAAFNSLQGMVWMQCIVAVAALIGIVTSLTVGLFSLSRIVMAASRDWLLPPFLARISPRTHTPLVAQLVFGVFIALLAMLVEVDAATSLVAFGTLVTLWMVCNVQLFRRYYPEVQMRFTRYGTVEVAPLSQVHSWVPGKNFARQTRKVLVAAHLVLINLVGIALAAYYGVVTSAYGPPTETRVATTAPAPSSMPSLPPQSQPPPPNYFSGTNVESVLTDTVDEGTVLTMSRGGAGWIALAWFLVTLSFQLCCPLEYQPPRWHIPNWLMPWLPSAALGLILFSVGALNHGDYWRVAVYFAVIIGFYLLFALPMSYMRHTRMDSTNAEELNVIELAFSNGRWQPLRMSVQTSARIKLGSSSSTRRTGSGRPSSLSATPSTPRSASQS